MNFRRLFATRTSDRQTRTFKQAHELEFEFLEVRTLLTSGIAPRVPPIPPQVAVPFDLEMLSATAKSGQSLEVRYLVRNPLPLPAGSLSFQFYMSENSVLDTNDSLKDTIIVCPLSGCGAVRNGEHTRTFTIGTGAGEVALPGVGISESNEDYHILAVARWSLDQFSDNNTTAMEGVYSDGNVFRPTVYVHGSSDVDTVQTSFSRATRQNTVVQLNGTTHQFTARLQSSFRIRTHGGNDRVNGSGIVAWGGAGDDSIVGGSRADILIGGSGNDVLDAGSGDDQLNGGTGNDTFIIEGRGSRSIQDTNGIDTLDMSGMVEAVTVDLGDSQVQSITVTGDTLEISADLENAIGTVFNDTLIGNSLDNHLIGATGDDVIDGKDGADHLEGGTGDDVIFSGSGDDSLDGSDGNDEFVISTSGSIMIWDSAGIDTLDFSSSAGPLTLRLGLDAGQLQPRDVTGTSISLTGTFENIFGTDFRDVLVGNSIHNLIDGRAGNDIIRGGNGQDSLVGNDGNDRLVGNLGDDNISGGRGNDILVGSSGDDFLSGGSGNDKLIGQSGADRANGDEGNDILLGGRHDDSLHGGSGNDRLVGHSGNDELSSGDGNDVLVGGSGADLLVAGNGLDRLSGQSGDDQLEGGPGNDRILGGSGNDVMLGQAGDDRLIGQGGGDSIFGGQGRDILSGGPGDDLVFGGPFFNGTAPSVDDVIRDILQGGSGRDRAFRSFSKDRFGSDIEQIIETIASITTQQ